MLAGVSKYVEAGSDLVSQQVKMLAAGETQLEVAEATKLAYAEFAKLGTISASKALDYLDKLQQLFGKNSGCCPSRCLSW